MKTKPLVLCPRFFVAKIWVNHLACINPSSVPQIVAEIWVNHLAYINPSSVPQILCSRDLGQPLGLHRPQFCTLDSVQQRSGSTTWPTKTPVLYFRFCVAEIRVNHLAYINLSSVPLILCSRELGNHLAYVNPGFVSSQILCGTGVGESLGICLSCFCILLNNVWKRSWPM